MATMWCSECGKLYDHQNPPIKNQNCQHVVCVFCRTKITNFCPICNEKMAENLEIDHEILKQLEQKRAKLKMMNFVEITRKIEKISTKKCGKCHQTSNNWKLCSTCAENSGILKKSQFAQNGMILILSTDTEILKLLRFCPNCENSHENHEIMEIRSIENLKDFFENWYLESFEKSKKSENHSDEWESEKNRLIEKYSIHLEEEKIPEIYDGILKIYKKIHKKLEEIDNLKKFRKIDSTDFLEKVENFLTDEQKMEFSLFSIVVEANFFFENNFIKDNNFYHKLRGISEKFKEIQNSLEKNSEESLKELKNFENFEVRKISEFQETCENLKLRKAPEEMRETFEKILKMEIFEEKSKLLELEVQKLELIERIEYLNMMKIFYFYNPSDPEKMAHFDMLCELF